MVLMENCISSSKTMRNLLILLLVFAGISLMFTGSVYASFDVSVGTNKLIYKTGDNATISGYVKYSSTGQPLSSASVLASVTYGGSEIFTNTTTTSSLGEYNLTSIPIANEGEYDIQVIVNSGQARGYGSFSAETEKKYTLTSDKFTYSVGENVTLTLFTESVLSNGSTTPTQVTTTLKIKLENGSVMKQETFTTNASGYAVSTYNLTTYGKYIAVIGNGLAIAKFEVPSFSVKTETMGEDETSRSLFSTDDKLVIKTVVTITGTTGQLPVKGANVKAYVKDADGNLVTTLSKFTETSDGVYKSNANDCPLNATVNGKHYVDVEVTKGASTQKERIWFEIETLRVDLIPFGDRTDIVAFLKAKNAKLGIVVTNMKTGSILTGDQVYTNGTEITECKNSKGESCLTQTGTGTAISGFKDFAKILNFTAPNSTGEFFLKVQVNTSSGLGIGDVAISVQDIAIFVETKDKYNDWKWEYSPGENVSMTAKAYIDWAEEEQVSSIEVLEVRNQTWSDVTSTVFPNSSSRTVNNETITFSAPQKPGWYGVKMKITTSTGKIGYAIGGLKVSLYRIWAETKDENGDWQWRFASNDDIYFYIDIRDLGGSIITSTNIVQVSISRIRNELTRREYSNLNVTDLGVDAQGRPIRKLSLSGTGVTSGFYMADLEIVDIDGNKEYGGAWFKISDLDISVTVKDKEGSPKWQFSPSDNITFDVTARYFNGSNVPDGSTVRIKELMMMKEGPPTPVPGTLYNTSGEASTSSGSASLWLKARTGKTLSQGHHMAIIEVNISGTIDVQEAWFDVRLMDVWGYAVNWIVGKNQTVSIAVSAKKMDGTAIENATVELIKLRDTKAWTDVTTPSANATTDSSGSATLQFSAPNKAGEYEANIRVTSDTLGTSSDIYTWFQVKSYRISGWFADQSKTVYAPEENIDMWVEIKHPNGSKVSGAEVSVYNFVDTESWPWTYKDATTVSTGTTDTQGKAKVTFKAPSSSGRYRPLINITLNSVSEESTDPWSMPDFQVRSASVGVTLYDNSTNQTRNKFAQNATVKVKINISNPSGGDISISQIKLVKYKDLNTQQETELGQTKSSNIGTNNYLYFNTPTTESEYVLYVSVTDNVTNNVIIEKRWFRVESFEVKFWQNQWMHSPEQNVSISIKASLNDNPVNVSVTLKDGVVRNLWTDQTINVTSDTGKIIYGNGIFNVTAPSNYGEYEGELWVCEQGVTCTQNVARRLWFGFSVESSFEAWGWPQTPSVTTDQNVELYIEAKSQGNMVSATEYDARFVELRDMSTWSNQTSSITVPIAQNETTRKKMTISAENLSTGEYMARINITKGSDFRLIEIWFKVSDFEIGLDTSPSTMYSERKFLTGENITFNISLTSTASSNKSGILKIRNNYKWEEVIETKSFTIAENETSTLVNVSINETGEYSATARIDTAEKSFWFQVGSFVINIKHWLSNHEVGGNDNLTIYFDIENMNGSEYTGDVDITIKSIRSSWDWNVINETDNMYTTTVTAGTGNEQFNFSHGRSTGEYDVEIEFDIAGKKQIEHFWFMVKDKIFEAWIEFPTPGQNNFEPGSNVTINAYVAFPNRTAWQNVNVSIVEVHKMQTWEDITDLITPLTMSALTDSNGKVKLNFTLPANLTGGIDVKLSEEGGQVAWIGFSVSSYDAWAERPDWKWTFTPGETFNANVYVYKSGVAQENVSIVAKLWKIGDWNSPYNSSLASGTTDSSGSYSLSFPAPAETGEFEVQIDVAGGAARIYEHFKVQTFYVWAWARGETSGTEDIGTNDTVVVTLDVKDSDMTTAIANANVTLIDVKNLRGWFSVNFTNVQNETTTNDIGRAEIRFLPPSEEGEYIAKINVTANVSGEIASNVGDAWFRVTPYTISFKFVCPPDISSCNPRVVRSDDQIYVNLTASGANSTKICLRRVKNMYSGIETDRGECNSTNNSSVVLAFTATSDTGSYDGIFDLYINDEFMGDKWEWFEVGGEYEMNAYIEPMNAWAGENATAFIEVWGTGWNPIHNNPDYADCSYNVTEIRDSWTWQIVTNVQNQWLQPFSQWQDGPPGRRLVFEVPSTLSAGEYEVKVSTNCFGGIERHAHLRVASFQVSSLMSQVVKTNETTNFWVKVTDGSGTPIQNATVYQRKLNDMMGWMTIETYNINYTTDIHGEVIGSFTTPDKPGDYMLLLEAEDSGGTTQQIDRWFRIKYLNVDVNIGGRTKFYTGENVTVYVSVSDAITGDAISGESVTLNVWTHTDKIGDEQNGTGGPGGPGGPGDGQNSYINITSGNGIATFSLNDLGVGEYELMIDICTYDKGCSNSHKSFVVKAMDISANIGGEIGFNPGDTINALIDVNYRNGTSYPENTPISSGVQLMSFGSGGNETSLYQTIGILNSSGQVVLNLSIPSNASSGPAVLWVNVLNSTNNTVGNDGFLIVIHANTTINGTVLNQSVSSEEFIDIVVSSGNGNLKIAPFVRHLEKIGDAIPMYQMMSGCGPESGKENWYFSPIYLNSSNQTHMKILAQKLGGNYSAMIPLISKGSEFFGPDYIDDMIFVDYSVAGDETPPATIMNLDAQDLQIGNSIRLNWTGSDATDLKEYRVYLNQSSVEITNVTNLTVNQTVSSTLTETTITGLQTDVNYSFAVTAVDLSENENKTIISSVVIKPTDSSPPAIWIISPTNTTYCQTNITVKITAIDLNLDTIWYYNGSSGNRTANNNELYYHTMADDNTHRITAYANDTSGNVNVTNVYFTINSSHSLCSNESASNISSGTVTLNYFSSPHTAEGFIFLNQTKVNNTFPNVNGSDISNVGSYIYTAGNAGIRDMGLRPMNNVTECPGTGYSTVLDITGDEKGHVACVKTMENKYAKIRIMNYTSGTNTKYDLEWMYQANGSRYIPGEVGSVTSVTLNSEEYYDFMTFNTTNYSFSGWDVWAKQYGNLSLYGLFAEGNGQTLISTNHSIAWMNASNLSEVNSAPTPLNSSRYGHNMYSAEIKVNGTDEVLLINDVYVAITSNNTFVKFMITNISEDFITFNWTYTNGP